MYNNFNMVMSISQFIGLHKFLLENRELDKKEKEALTSIAKITSTYTRKVKESGKKTNRIVVLISFKSNKTKVKDIKLVNITYVK